MSEKKIAILIPSFKDIRILETIASIKRSDPDAISRIYVLDGGSSEEIILKIKNALRDTDMCLSEADRGIFDALNKGLNIATEEIVGWLGADDYFTSSIRFSEIATCFYQEHLDCYIFNKAYSDGKVIRRITPAVHPTLWNYRIGRIVPHFSSFWSRETIGTLRFSLDYPNAADQQFFIELASRGNLKVHIDRRIGTVMGLGGASTGSFKHILKGNRHTFEIFRKYMGPLSATFAVFMKLAWKVLETCWRFIVRPPLPHQ